MSCKFGPKATKGALLISACLLMSAAGAVSDEQMSSQRSMVYGQQSSQEQSAARTPRVERRRNQSNLLGNCAKRARADRQVCKRQAARLLGAIRTLATFGILGANGRAS